MIWLLVPDLVFFCRTPRFGPPVRRLFIAASIRMRRLLLGLDRFDPSLGNQLACRLLAVLESLFIEIPDGLGVADFDAFAWGDSHGHVVVIDDWMTRSGSFASLSR